MAVEQALLALVGAADTGAYQINQSLRFNSADSAYLNRTPASAGNRRTWTLSFWFKRGKLGTSQNLFAVSDNYGTPSSANYFYIALETDDKMYVQQIYPTYNAALDFSPNGRVFRDASAWYHVVLAIDTTQATGSNRQKMWINGELQTLVNGTSGGPTTISQNYDTTVNTTNEHRLGYYRSTYYTDGYLAEVNFIDGTALTPSSFGETDTITGAWIPKKYSGSYGTNGFYLKFESSGIGTDSSGNGNTWTANNFSTSGTGTDVMSDTPTNNWCTFNPLANAWSNTGSGSTADGNLYLAYSSGNWYGKKGTIAVSSGKWYYEWTNTSGGTSSQCGFTTIESASETGSGVYRYRSDATKINTTQPSYGATWSTAGDIIGVALDIDGGTITFYKNGTSQGTAFSSIPAGTYIPECVIEGAGYTGYANFGQRSFSYTPPSNFKALCTANLPEPTIKKGSKYFDTKLYTGTDASLTVNYDFSPDFVWIKSRSHASDNSLYDIVRGTNLQLRSNSTNAEINDTNGFNSFNSNGFTLGVDTGDNINAASRTYVAWAWDANGAGSSNTAGSITSTVSANATAGFSIVTYTGNATAGATVGHGLGVAPKMIICKRRQNNAAGTSNWQTYHASLGATKLLYLNTTTDALTGDSPWNNTAPTSTVFTLGDNPQGNPNGDNVVAYCFSEVAGYSKFGSYTGNGSTDGPFVFCGFRPAWILTKRTDASASWTIEDAARIGHNPNNYDLYPDTSDAEGDNDRFDILSNGFKARATYTSSNASGGTYIFAAFSETAFKFANAR